MTFHTKMYTNSFPFSSGILFRLFVRRSKKTCIHSNGLGHPFSKNIHPFELLQLVTCSVETFIHSNDLVTRSVKTSIRSNSLVTRSVKISIRLNGLVIRLVKTSIHLNGLVTCLSSLSNASNRVIMHSGKIIFRRTSG